MAAALRDDVDILRPLSSEEVNQLLELYKNKYGARNFHYLLMYNQCKWNKQLQEINAYDDKKWISFRKAFYTHRRGNFRKYGTYVNIHVDTMQSLSFHSWQHDHKDLFECLNETKLIDWKNGPLLTNVDLEICVAVKLIALAKGASVQRARTSKGLIMAHDKALYLKVPDLPAGYTCRGLDIDNAELIHSLWANTKEASVQFIRGLIQFNKTLGVYRDVDNELVAWIFQNDYSGLGILYVIPLLQRNGLGTFLALYLSKLIATSEIVELSVWHEQANLKSEALLKKIGYEDYVTNQWIQLNKSNN